MQSAPRARLHVLSSDESDAAGATLVTAFMRDPVNAWFNKGRTQEEMRGRAEALFAQVLARLDNTVIALDDYSAASVWEYRTMEPEKRALEGPAARIEVTAFMAAVEALAPPLPYTYLAFLGAKESGKGSGSELLKRTLQLHKGKRVFLWTGTSRNATFYKRHGFHVYSECHVPGSSCWWMFSDVH
ncbi:hypothetical protein BC830DRAFT_1106319 [Chytriomyces sp. MP71]|nr:hypothetical protein BC830DRAFT_1106319 [Chytriomyces sp. MP71]